MASRPLYASGSSTQIKEMPDTEFSNMLGRIGYLYSTNPFVDVDVSLSGGNAGPALTDTRYRSGPLGQSTGDQDAFDDGLLEYDRNPGGPELITVANYDRLNQYQNYAAGQLPTATFDANYYTSQDTKPVKWNKSTNSFEEMTYLECVEAFIDQWYISQSKPSASNAGSSGAYFISSNTSEPGATQVSSTPVFVDTVADAGSYSTALIGGAGVTYITNNFTAQTGSGSGTVLTNIGGSGVSVSYSTASVSGPNIFGFGDDFMGGGAGSGRPNGVLGSWFTNRINNSGQRSNVINKDAYDEIYPYYSTYIKNLFNSYYGSGRNKSVAGYPTAVDQHIVDHFASEVLTASGVPDTFGGGDPFWDDHYEFDLSGDEYLYIWAGGEVDANTKASVTIRLLGTNGNERQYSLSARTNLTFTTLLGPYPFFQQNYVDPGVNSGILTNGSGNASIAGDGWNAMRFHIDGKVSKAMVSVRSGRHYTTGFATTRNLIATATNNTGYSIQTPVGTPRSASSSWSLPVNASGQWTLAAGTWQTSQVVGAAAQSNVVTFNEVTGSGTTADAALASLGGGIDVTVNASGTLNATRRYTSNSSYSSVNSTVHGVGKTGWTGGYAFSYTNLLSFPTYGNAFSGDTGTTRAGFRIPPDAQYAQVTVANSGAPPFDPGGVNNLGITFRNTSNQSFAGFSSIESGGNVFFSGPYGFTTTISGTSSQLYTRSSSIFELPSDKSHCYAYVFKQPGMYIYVTFYGGAVAQNNTGFDIETPVGVTRAAGTTWVLPSTTATPTGAWKIEAGRYYVSSGTETYQDHFTTTNYYLHQMDQQKSTQGSGYKTPLVVDYDGNGDARGLRAMTYQEFDDFFDPLVKYVTSSLPGYRLNYNINGNGINIGSPILNQQMVGVTSQLSTRFVNVNDYRSQTFPNGVIVAQDTHRFKLEKY